MAGRGVLFFILCAGVALFSCFNSNNPAGPGDTAPAITTHPSSQTVTEGSPVAFNVVATGDPAPTYQWQKDGSDIAGATNATYSIASATSAHSGVYRCVVTNSAGSVTSNPATLTVNPSGLAAPVIVTQPLSQAVNEGENVTFTVVATGNPAPAYQWRKDGVTIPGATGSTYTIASVTFADVGSYTVFISNSQGNITSNAATLTINEGPEVLTYTVNGDSITVNSPERVYPYSYCDDSTLSTGYDTSEAWTETMWFSISGNTLTFDMGGLVIMSRVGTGSGLIGTWVTSDTGYDMPDTLIFDATHIYAYGGDDGDRCPAADYLEGSWPWDSAAFNGTAAQISCTEVRITGNTTGEVVTITWNSSGDMTYSSSNGSHTTHTWYKNPTSCPNNWQPEWWWSYLNDNQKAGTTPTVQFTAAGQNGAENAGTMTITAQLSETTSQAVTVPFSVGGTALQGTDYSITLSPLSIPAGSQNAQIIITIVDDNADENDETVVVTMGTPTNASLGPTHVHTATIIDNDSIPVGPDSIWTYTIKGSNLIIYHPQVTVTECDGNDDLITNTTPAYTDTMGYVLSGTNDTLWLLDSDKPGDTVTLVRTGTGSGVQGQWQMVIDSMNVTIDVDATTITASACFSDPFMLSVAPLIESMFNITVTRLSCNAVLLTGTTTGEQVTVSFTQAGNSPENLDMDATYSSDNPLHSPPGTVYANPTSCPNEAPDWVDLFMMENYSAPAAKKAAGASFPSFKLPKVTLF